MFARRRGAARGSRRFGEARLNLRQRIDAIADAARRWSDADFPPRVRATRALIARTGYTEPVVDYALDALFEEITAPAIRAAIAGELGSLDALERFVSRAGRPDVRYAGVARACILSSETTIGVAIPALAFALCAGARTIVKDRSDGLVAAFRATLIEERPEFASAFEAHDWDATDARATALALDADTVMAYGRAETLATIRAALPANARFEGFGPRTSVGYVAREALGSERAAREAARGIARDALLYDGEGCLSLHAVFVERGGAIEPRAFAHLVAEALDETAVEFPAGYAEFDAAGIAYRRAALFRAAQGAGEFMSGVTAPHAVAFEPPRDEPPPLIRRIVAVYATGGPETALAFVRAHALPLEAVAFTPVPTRDPEALERGLRPNSEAFAGPLRPDLEAFAVASGAARVALLGTLQRPPLGGEHGGAGRILPFVRAIYRG